MTDDDKLVLICMPAEASAFSDDVRGQCDTCGLAICWRPTAPDGARVCLGCAPFTDKVYITRESLLEVVLYLAKPKGSA